MAKFSVSRNFSMPKDAVRDAAEALAQQLQADHDLRYSWQGDTATFSRSGIDGKLAIADGVITVSVKLGMLASAFERPLKQAMNDYLDQYIS